MKTKHNLIANGAGWLSEAIGRASLLGLLLLSSCSVQNADKTQWSDTKASNTTDEAFRVAESFRLVEGVAIAVEQYVPAASDPELSAAWEFARAGRSAPDVGAFIDSLRLDQSSSSIDTTSSVVITYLNSLAPVLAELQNRYEKDALAEPLDVAYARLSEQSMLNGDTGESIHQKKKRDHCCSYYYGILGDVGCIQVSGSDLGAFLRCLGLIGSSFTVGRGVCDEQSCSFIDHR